MRRARDGALQELRRGVPSLCRRVPQDGRLIGATTPAPSVMTSVPAHHPLHGHDAAVLGPVQGWERWTVVRYHYVWRHLIASTSNANAGERADINEAVHIGTSRTLTSPERKSRAGIAGAAPNRPSDIGNTLCISPPSRFRRRRLGDRHPAERSHIGLLRSVRPPETSRRGRNRGNRQAEALHIGIT